MVVVRIEPSLRLLPGLYLQINDHVEADPETLKDRPDQLLERLRDGWAVAMERGDRIVESIRHELHALT
jgi:hypothetical protein